VLLEGLVAGVCVFGNSGCGNATTAYYESNKELKDIVHHYEQMGNKLLKGNEYIVYVLTPIVAVGSGKPATFKLSGNFTLSVDFRNQALGIKWSY
jgi:hypothetical protein